MKSNEKLALSVRCPTCGAKLGEKCELATGQPRTNPHRWRVIANDKENPMFAMLRAELKAITECDRKTSILRTQVEKDAVVIRQMRRREIILQLTKIITTN